MIGQIISHYKILEKLGEGGMGVVYKAQDTKLDRFVALKFLPDHVAAGSNELERFLIEAKAAASLNHPNICTIYGIEEADKKHFIVLEFVDGQTLQEKKSSLSQKQALDIGIQIAEGLAAAHEKGIVHRDIKPENIMIRKDGIVQVMDFGLAKLRGASRLTKEGSTVGTAGYMSPEQVQGYDTDHRSDIFSLGVLLYEMLAGQIPFKGVHETAIAYEIVNVDSPPISSIKPEITPELDSVILECLEKDPKERTQSASQVALDLKRCRRESSRSRASRITAARPAMSSSGQSTVHDTGDQIPGHIGTSRKVPQWLIVSTIALAMGIVGFVLSYFTASQESEIPVIIASINTPSGIFYSDKVGGQSAISPDGSMIVFLGNDSLARSLLWIRTLPSNETKYLAGTEDAQYPFWSYNSRSVGFFANGKVKTVDVKGGPVMVLADAPFGRGGTWSSSGEIVYSPSVTDVNLYAVPEEGGPPRVVARLDSSSNAAPRFPSMLPDGDHFLFSRLILTNTGNNRSDIYVGSLKTGESKKLLEESSYAVYASGYMLFLRQNILVAQPFDAGSLSVTGKPVSIEENINSWNPRAKADVSISQNGLLLYAKGSVSQGSEVLWMQRDGASTFISEITPFSKISLSPDNEKIVYDKMEVTNNGGISVWIYDIKNNIDSRLTFGSSGSNPVWSSDGKKIYYSVEVGGSKANIAMKLADGSGEEKIIAQGGSNSTVQYRVEDVSPDGNTLLIRVGNESGSKLAAFDIATAKMTDLGINGGSSRFSPDGKWIVYLSNESEGSRLFVVSFNGIAGKWQLPSQSSFGEQLWLNGKIVYYSSAKEYYEECDVSFPNGRPSFGQPKPLFQGVRQSTINLFGALRDGKKFLVNRTNNGGGGSTLTLIVNWKAMVESGKQK